MQRSSWMSRSLHFTITATAMTEPTSSKSAWTRKCLNFRGHLNKCSSSTVIGLAVLPTCLRAYLDRPEEISCKFRKCAGLLRKYVKVDLPNNRERTNRALFRPVHVFHRHIRMLLHDLVTSTDCRLGANCTWANSNSPCNEGWRSGVIFWSCQQLLPHFAGLDRDVGVGHSAADDFAKFAHSWNIEPASARAPARAPAPAPACGRRRRWTAVYA